ncbi:uncharacterized protein LOC134841391 isoform X2 [Symsagittifera roscoffensis]|uniref:uncharacterized protein LOC134841391 isoform X2 n=1 Tax=Symsagittifera roscoffensis TaxID=84072 RepID=UPI00307B38C5
MLIFAGKETVTVYCEVMGDKTHPEYLKEGGAFFTSFVGEYLAHINDKEMGEYADGCMDVEEEDVETVKSLLGSAKFRQALAKFCRIDADGSGQISEEEVKQEFGEGSGKFLKRVQDSDGDNMISMAEYMLMLK